MDSEKNTSEGTFQIEKKSRKNFYKTLGANCNKNTICQC